LWAEAKRGVGDLQRVLTLGDHYCQVRGHAGLEFEVGIPDVDNHVVGDDVLIVHRIESNLVDRPAEVVSGEGVNREVHAVTLIDYADVGLIDVGDYLHLGQVVGDGEEGRRLETGRDRLSLIDVAGDDHAVDRRADRRIAQIDFGHFERTFDLLNLRAGLFN